MHQQVSDGENSQRTRAFQNRCVLLVPPGATAADGTISPGQTLKVESVATNSLQMLTLVIGGIVLSMTALAVLIHSASHTAAGFEDDFGFHEFLDLAAENLRSPLMLARMANDEEVNRAATAFPAAQIRCGTICRPESARKSASI
jgi:hypothetical protein